MLPWQLRRCHKEVVDQEGCIVIEPALVWGCIFKNHLLLYLYLHPDITSVMKPIKMSGTFTSVDTIILL